MRRGLLDQLLDEIASLDRRKAGDVEDRLLGIHRGDLAARLLERVEHRGRQGAHARRSTRRTGRPDPAPTISRSTDVDVAVTVDTRSDRYADALLDGDGLGQVARLVDVVAARQRDLGGQDLQRDDRDERRRAASARRAPRSGAPRARRAAASPCLGDDDGARAAGLDLGDVAEHLLVQQRRVRSGDGITTTTGRPSSMSAIGPCFSSPAGKPSACMYASSLSFSAPSSATG